MRGPDVRRLQARLAQLSYYPGPRDGRFGLDTLGAERVEVDLRHEVLYVYHHNQVVLISHVSSGGGYYYCVGGSCAYAVTPAGNFRTLSRDSGWHVAPLGLLYNPVFFHGGYAIHGDTEVPLQPVSHGCVRIPMDVANIFPRLVPRNGIPVYVRR
jgi:lipoprotein-anchoring transpeptidase ErfK/SrfK